jgi:hypothetical protein
MLDTRGQKQRERWSKGDMYLTPKGGARKLTKSEIPLA